MYEIKETLHSLIQLRNTKKRIQNDLDTIIQQRKAEVWVMILETYNQRTSEIHGKEILFERMQSPHEHFENLIEAIASAIVTLPLLEEGQSIIGFNITSIKKPDGFDLALFLGDFNSFSIKYFGAFLIEQDGLLRVKLKLPRKK